MVDGFAVFVFEGREAELETGVAGAEQQVAALAHDFEEFFFAGAEAAGVQVADVEDGQAVEVVGQIRVGD